MSENQAAELFGVESSSEEEDEEDSSEESSGEQETRTPVVRAYHAVGSLAISHTLAIVSL